MDDEAVADLLVLAQLRAPCAALRARCRVSAELHRWWVDVLHTGEDAEHEDQHRIVSWRTLTDTSREAQTEVFGAWFARLHAPQRLRLSPATSDGDGRAPAPRDAGAPADTPGSGSVTAAGDGGLGDRTWDRVGSSRAD
jgi:hypothetical protein